MKTAIACALLLSAAAPAMAAPDIAAGIKADMPGLMALYRDLHAHPELSLQEVRTPALLAAEARKLGFEVTEKVGKTGVVAVLRNGPGPVVMIRADMDALPVTEKTGLPFASKVTAKSADGVTSGVMHACGHDTHVTGWLGTAKRLVATKSDWSGTVVMILQPAEEMVAGARDMLADGLFTRFPKPDYLLAFHDSAALPAGTIGMTSGYALANVDSANIEVLGLGGHGAYPATTKDPIVLASKIVMALQTLVSRENDPLDPAVVTVGVFQAGTRENIIPDHATLRLTIRTYSPETRKLMLDGIRRIARGEAIASGLPEDRMPQVTISEVGADATYNSEPLTGRLTQTFTDHFGKDRVKAVRPSMAAEDFGAFWLADKSKQSTIFWVGGVPRDKWAAANGDTSKLPSLHSPFWAPDAEAVVGTAAEAMTVAVLDLLNKN